tara:strand:+ start:372 stop:533 length:162 start_codon:yes stop_codon:yes gene_type:complete
MEINEEEQKIVNKYVAIHEELKQISKTMADMQKRSEELLNELYKLRESEKKQK